jgi:hypothetical protein
MDVQRDTSQQSDPLAFFTFMMLPAQVTNWEPHGVTLAGCCYVTRHGMKFWIVTPYGVSHMQRYGVTVRGEVTSVYQPLIARFVQLFAAIPSPPPPKNHTILYPSTRLHLKGKLVNRG